MAALPFADKPKLNKKELRSLRHKNDDVHRARMADVPAPVVNNGDAEGIPDAVGHARERAELLQRLRQLHNAYQSKEKDKMVARTTQYKAKRAAETQAALARNKKKRKEFFSRRGGKGGARRD